ncbi:MAG: ELWxxDGT repeat protein, partial [Acidobacteriota bacterium]
FDSAAVGDRWFFTAESDGFGTELWMTDGTLAGTRQVADLLAGPGSSLPRFLMVAGDRVYLRATTSDDADSLVAFDSQGAMLGSLVLPAEAIGDQMATVGDRLLWAYRTGFAEPEALWVGDADFSNRTLLGSFQNLWRLTSAGEGAMIERLVGNVGFELWITDGTPAGTVLRENLSRIGAVVPGDGRVFFSAATAAHGEELWVSDGTLGGTRLVADLEPGPESSSPLELAAITGGVLFSARTAAEGREPWVSTGEAEGTRLLSDLVPGPRGSHPEDFNVAGDTVLFSAYRDDVGRELFSVPSAALLPTCTPSATSLCLNQGRFRVEVAWRDFEGGTGPGRPVPVNGDDSGLLYFFDPDNWEMLIKVLDGCAINDHYWVFAAATTDVEYTLTVTDTSSGEHAEYFNPLGNASPAITDTGAFATCP